MPQGQTTGSPLRALQTSVGVIYPPDRNPRNAADLAQIALLTALKGDGQFTASMSVSPLGGYTLTIVTNARTLVIDGLRVPGDELQAAIGWINGEQKQMANL